MNIGKKTYIFRLLVLAVMLWIVLTGCSKDAEKNEDKDSLVVSGRY